MGPATQAAQELDDGFSPDEACWYRELIATWESGGRPASFKFLQDQRDAALASLKLSNS